MATICSFPLFTLHYILILNSFRFHNSQQLHHNLQVFANNNPHTHHQSSFQMSSSNYLPLDLSNSNQLQASSSNYRLLNDVIQPQASNNSVKPAPPKFGVSLPPTKRPNNPQIPVKNEPQMSFPSSSHATSPTHFQASSSNYHLLEDVKVNQLLVKNQHDSMDNQTNSIQPAVLNQTTNLVPPLSKVFTMLPIDEGL